MGAFPCNRKEHGSLAVGILAQQWGGLGYTGAWPLERAAFPTGQTSASPGLSFDLHIIAYSCLSDGPVISLTLSHTCLEHNRLIAHLQINTDVFLQGHLWSC